MNELRFKYCQNCEHGEIIYTTDGTKIICLNPQAIYYRNEVWKHFNCLDYKDKNIRPLG